METLLALAIVGAIAPFVYDTMSGVTIDIANAAEATQVKAWGGPVMAYVRKNNADWPANAGLEFDAEEIVKIGTGKNKLTSPYAGFIEKRTESSGVIINAYLVFRPKDISAMRVHKIAKLLGRNAAVADDNGTAQSPSGWRVSSDVFAVGDLVFRISDILGMDDSEKYLHRTFLDSLDMNTMRRDLDMGKHSIVDGGTINTQVLNATNGNLWLVETPVMKVGEIYFPFGATLNGSRARFNSLSINGDMNSFRKITAGKFKGTGAIANTQWSSRGNVVADYVNILGDVNVNNGVRVASSTARTISGFASVATGSVATSYLSASDVLFASGAGITISSELLYSNADAPLQLGKWVFPSENGPEFNRFILGNSGDITNILSVPNNKEFDLIMGSNWKDIR